jgi:acyl-coenzyme A thioesterase PaaI-like protein
VAEQPVHQQSVQDRFFPGFTCFGCGPANPAGLRLKSYAQGDVVSATFVPWAEHDNGFGTVNGGVLSTVLDCHSAAAVFTEAARRGWVGEDGLPLPWVTAGLDVRFLRPAPLAGPLLLTGSVIAATESEMTAAVELAADGKVRATGVAVWKRLRPRP